MIHSQLIQYIRKNWFWLLVNLAVLLLLVRLSILIWTTSESNIIALFATQKARNVVLFSGKSALVLLILSLSCTPLATILGFRQAITVRKSLGLWGFGFALFHALFLIGNKAIFYDVEAWRSIWYITRHAFEPDIWAKMPYARAGVYALALLIPLALTSNQFTMRLLRKNWKRLHRLVYLAIPVAVWHYWWRENFAAEWGFPTSSVRTSSNPQRILFAVIVAVLLLVRIPQVRKQLSGFNRKHSTKPHSSMTSKPNPSNSRSSS